MKITWPVVNIYSKFCMEPGGFRLGVVELQLDSISKEDNQEPEKVLKEEQEWDALSNLGNGRPHRHDRFNSEFFWKVWDIVMSMGSTI